MIKSGLSPAAFEEPSDGRTPAALAAVVLPAITWVVLFAFMTIWLRRPWLFHDIPGYIEDSVNWRTPFRDVHVPGYPLTIALLRGATAGMIPTLWLMYALNIAAMFFGCGALLRALGAAAGRSVATACGVTGLFVLWPFVGLNSIVSPLAEVPAMAFFMWGVISLYGSRPWLAAMLLGVAALFHKGVWPYIGLVVIGDWLSVRRPWKTEATIGLIVAAPLLLLWIIGVVHYGDPWWILSKSLRMGAESRRYYLPFEGVWQTLTQDGLKGLTKGVVLIGFIGFLLYILRVGAKLEAPYRNLAVALAIAALLWFAFLTKLEQLAAVRFSRLTVMVLAWSLMERKPDAIGNRREGLGVAALLVVLFATQLAGAWHMHRKLIEDGIMPN